MPTLALLVLLLLVLVCLLSVGALGCAVYRHPALSQPLMVALAGAALLVAVVAIAAAR
ncbi:hypothetical protein ABZ686_03975 [Streptomyces sp. NPDC006992]|uniref:hypothetical protein n=1 Tax=Streptomyces sp. NPDC006992 TaxID=3155601 RepID=UPI0033C3934D